MTFKRSLIALALIAGLTACDGDDGAQGPSGIDGTPGQDGAPGMPGADAPTALEMTLVGRSVLNAEDPEGAAEIVAYQTSKSRVYAVNSSVKPAVVEVLDLYDMEPETLTANDADVVTNTNLESIITLNLEDSSGLSGDANSIAIDDNNELLAVAIASGDAGVNGHVAFFDLSGDAPSFIKNVEVGDLPDSLAFSYDGTKVVVANEGEPSDDYTLDPEGTISVINVVDGVPQNNAVSINFNGYNEMQSDLEAMGMKFSNPTGQMIKGQLRSYTVSQDLEPEYVAFSKDNTKAFVSLQENNGLAVVNLADNSVSIVGLGYKDWSDYLIDVSDKDDGINFQSYDHLYGMYQPDTIATYHWQGANFIVTANEGDGREYIAFERDAEEDAGKVECEADFPSGIYEWEDGEEVCIAYTDESRVKDLEDFGVVSAELEAYVSEKGGKDGLGRLLVTNALGKNADDEYDSLYAYGARSFTIWDENGLVVFDSGDEIERITAAIHGSAFNNNEDENEGDTRSDAKGPEPEALAIGQVGSQTYAFVGLERMGSIVVYNITNPFEAKFVDYFVNRGLIEGADISGDLAPEGMRFIAAEDSPNGQALLVIGNEISGSVAIWQIEEK